MAIEDNASIALIPSGYKSGKLYSVIPESGNGDFTHSRGSTATRVAASGLIETVASGVPRLDYPLIDGVVQDCPALLLEPSRTNNMSHSEDFSVYTSAAASRTANAGTSPTGENNATLIYPSSSGSNKGLYKLTATSTTATLSCFVKRSGKNFAILGSDNNSTYYCVFDLENENVAYEATNYTGKIEKYSNGWYRISSTYVSSTAQNYPFIGVADNSSGAVTVDGTNGILIFGMQYEYNSYKTSYIKTSGSAVTRSADVCNGSGTSAEFNDSEGVLFAEIAALANDGNYKFITINDGNFTDRVAIAYTNSDNQVRVQLTVGGIDSYIKFQSITDATEFIKIAVKYKASDFAIWINGVEYQTQSSGSVFPSGTLNSLSFDNGAGGSDFYGKTKQLMTFKTALTDSELETLTSWDSFNAMAKGQLYTIE